MLNSCSSPYRKAKNDGKPRAIIARFVNRDNWYRQKELANSPNHRHVILVPDYAYETAKEQKKNRVKCSAKRQKDEPCPGIYQERTDLRSRKFLFSGQYSGVFSER